ncbi:putative ADP-ribosylation factor GTPase activating protein [Leptomonas seymouri]|uniref:Putative ADP-ribosylation factor GTPase activating protein n=1 Tax=Leptomonas seymouri TaxID=5684 RepID=A0A0N0P456_LEPSE|nr:putative ADP-ribosylation factor GTPase activating protein [Leptomonas seymouri]|eukprot:KPI84906.1 putative ADP-ribosylation factor GTPase activating protein [Leptomonas seymouri]
MNIRQRKAERHKEALRKLSQEGGNKYCFDCAMRGPLYVVSDFNILVCSGCSAVHRSFQHKVKGITMSEFTEDEIARFTLGGNDTAGKVWLSTFNRKHPRSGEVLELKDFIRDTFVDRRYCDQVAYARLLKVWENPQAAPPPAAAAATSLPPPPASARPVAEPQREAPSSAVPPPPQSFSSSATTVPPLTASAPPLPSQKASNLVDDLFACAPAPPPVASVQTSGFPFAQPQPPNSFGGSSYSPAAAPPPGPFMSNNYAGQPFPPGIPQQQQQQPQHTCVTDVNASTPSRTTHASDPFKDLGNPAIFSHLGGASTGTTQQPWGSAQSSSHPMPPQSALSNAPSSWGGPETSQAQPFGWGDPLPPPPQQQQQQPFSNNYIGAPPVSSLSDPFGMPNGSPEGQGWGSPGSNASYSSNASRTVALSVAKSGEPPSGVPPLWQ